LELIVVDNHSEDNTAEIVSTWIAKDDRVRYLKHHNHGVIASSRNRGIESARGEYVAFLDSDDGWSPEKLAKQMPVFRQPEIGFACTRSIVVDAQNQVLNDWRKQPALSGRVLEPLIRQEFLIPSSSVVVRRSVLRERGLQFQYGRQGTEDWDLWLRLAGVTELGFVPEPLITRRHHEAGVSRNTELMFQSTLTTLRDLRTCLQGRWQQEMEPLGRLLQACNVSEAQVLFRYAGWLAAHGRRGEAWARHGEGRALGVARWEAVKTWLKLLWRAGIKT